MLYTNGYVRAIMMGFNKTAEKLLKICAEVSTLSEADPKHFCSFIRVAVMWFCCPLRCVPRRKSEPIVRAPGASHNSVVARITHFDRIHRSDLEGFISLNDGDEKRDLRHRVPILRLLPRYFGSDIGIVTK